MSFFDKILGKTQEDTKRAKSNATSKLQSTGHINANSKKTQDKEGSKTHHQAQAGRPVASHPHHQQNAPHKQPLKKAEAPTKEGGPSHHHPAPRPHSEPALSEKRREPNINSNLAVIPESKSNQAETARAVKINKDFPIVPSLLLENVLVDHANKIVYVNTKTFSNPLYMSWFKVVEDKYLYRQEPCPIEKLAELMKKGVGLVGGNQEQAPKGALALAVSLISRTVAIQATDLHIVVRENLTEICVRHKGTIKLMDRLTHAEGRALCRVLFMFEGAQISTYKEKECQSAQISGNVLLPFGLSSIRMERGPCYPVEKDCGFVAARLQKYEVNTDPPKEILELAPSVKLTSPPPPPEKANFTGSGLTVRQQEMLERIMETTSGLVLVTGPTGSGKTSLLNQMLRHVSQIYPGKRLITAEDPVEIPMPWAIQIPIMNTQNEKASGDGFSNALRVMLRMDPEIILLGELRGADSALAAVNAALTGHFVTSTLHVFDPFLAIDRLEIMDNVRLNRKVTCDPKLIRAVIAQRIVTVLCQNCAVPMKSLAEPGGNTSKWLCEAVATYGDVSNVKVRGIGCDMCGGDGIVGRTAIAEIVPTSSALMSDYIEHGTATARKNHRAKPTSDKSMMGNAMDRVLRGEIDPHSVCEFIDPIVPKGTEDE